jgi:hypothetical protein
MAEGWIQVERSIADSIVNSDPGLLHVWFNLRLRAAFKDGWYKLKPIKAGQCVFGRENLAKDLGISPSTLRRKLNLLAEHGFIAIHANHAWHNSATLVTLLDWPTSVSSEPPSEPPAERPKERPSEPPAGTPSEPPVEPANELPNEPPGEPHSKKVINKKTSSPLPPAVVLPAGPFDPDAEAWKAVEVEVFELGVDLAADVCRKARSKKNTPADVRAVMAHWKAHRPAWGVEALARRIMLLVPNQPVDRCWPKPNPSAEQSQRVEQQSLDRRRERDQRRTEQDRERKAARDLETRFGSVLDAMSRKEIIQLTHRECGEAAKGLLMTFAHGRPLAGLHRQELLHVLAKQDQKHPATKVS